MVPSYVAWNTRSRRARVVVNVTVIDADGRPDGNATTLPVNVKTG